MKSVTRLLRRYWFIIPILLVVILLQLGFGFVVAQNLTGRGNTSEATPSATASATPEQETVVVQVTATATPSATSTPAPLPTFTPTSTPTDTSTPTPTNTPTGTLTPTSTPTPSATPTNTSTPTPQPTPSASHGFTATVPILMYHYLSDPPPGADAIRRDLSVSPARFDAQLAWLRENGFQTITMKELSYALSQGDELPPKPIVISFDDGHRDNYVNAFPMLQKYGFTAIFYVFTQVIDTNNVDYLTWEMVTKMDQAGMEFGSHSYRHADLANRDDDFLVYEILGSKEAIEERVQEPVRFFSYPAGRYDASTIRIVESANFWGAVTTEWGADQQFDNRFEMPRIRMRGDDTTADLANKLDWF